MTRWIAILALIIGVGGIAFFWIGSNDINQKIDILEQKMTNAEMELQKEISSLSENIQQLREQTGKLTEQTGQLTERTGQLTEQAGQLKQETGKLVAAKQALEQEANTLRTDPSSLIDVIDWHEDTSGVFTRKSKIDKVYLRNKSRFNVKEIQIHTAYLGKNQVETGTNTTLYVHNLLVAGESKWFEAFNAPRMEGLPSARMRVTSVEVIAK